jgi:hypothetical protein
MRLSEGLDFGKKKFAVSSYRYREATTLTLNDIMDRADANQFTSEAGF